MIGAIDDIEPSPWTCPGCGHEFPYVPSLDYCPDHFIPPDWPTNRPWPIR